MTATCTAPSRSSVTDKKPVSHRDDPQLSILLDRFDTQWASGVVPEITDFLPAAESEETCRSVLIELVTIDLDRRWRAKTLESATLPPAAERLPLKPTLEDYVARFPQLGPLDSLPLALIGDEYRVRKQWGDGPDHAEFVRRFPTQSNELQPLLAQIDTQLSQDSTVDMARQATADEDTRPPSTVDALRTSPDEFTGSPLGKKFGDYEIIEEIARGGMGVVFKARQVQLNRTVALKTIRSGELAGAEEIQRFRTEAEAAAQLDHPDIVPIYEVGEQNGLHFFSMGLVDGEGLDARLREGPLPPQEAAELMEAIAMAIAYAHEKGIVHRDLKPSNVLIDRDGKPRITDFGLAKNIGKDSGMTATGAIMGTPSYMPPEQAAGKSEEIGPLSDVYALGAILYASVTGRPPFQAANALETLKQVCEMDPVSPRGLNPTVDRDLETICLKCLQREPQKRYTSAAELASDLRRWLNGEPIQARPASQVERAVKWVKRKPALALAAAVMMVAVPVSTTAAVWAVRARDAEHSQRKKAEASAVLARDKEREAERERDTALAVQDFLRFDIMRQADPTEQATRLLERGDTGGRVSPDLTLREALDRAAERLTESDIQERFPDNPLAQAAILQTAGDTYVGLGEYEKAIPFLSRAASTIALVRDDDHLDVLRSRRKLASALNCAGDYPQAIQWMEQVVDQCEAHFGDDHHDTINARSDLASIYAAVGRLEDAIQLWERVLSQSIAELGESHSDTLTARNNLAWAYQETGQLPKAIELFELALRQSENTLGKEHPDTLVSVQNLALAYNADGRPEEAIPLLENALQLFADKMGDDHPSTLSCQNSLAYVYKAAGRGDDALQLWAENLNLREAKLGEDHPETLTSRNNLAAAYYAAGLPDKAVPLMERTLESRERILGDDHPTTIVSRTNLAVVYRAAGRAAEALPHYQKTLDQYEEKHGPEHSNTLTAVYNLAGGYESIDELDKAIELYERAYRGVEKLQFEHPHSLSVLGNLAVAYGKAGQFAKKKAVLQVRLELLKTREPLDVGQVAVSHGELGDCLFREQQFVEAKASLQEALGGYAQVAPDSWRVFAAKSLIGACELALENYAEAETQLLSAHAGMTEMFASTDPAVTARLPAPATRTTLLRETASRLTELYDSTDRPEDARKWREELAELDAL